MDVWIDDDDKGKKGKQGEREHTTAEPMVIHLAGIALDVIMLRGALGDLEGVAGDDNVGGVGAAGPFLAVGAVAEGRDGGLARVFILDGGAHAGAFGHGGQGLDWTVVLWDGVNSSGSSLLKRDGGS